MPSRERQAKKGVNGRQPPPRAGAKTPPGSRLPEGPPGSVLLPFVAELIPRGDGNFVLRPRVACQDLDAWVSVRDAARILDLKPRSVYKLLDEFLVYRRPLPTRIRVSLQSALALRQATQDENFWHDPALMTSFKNDVSRAKQRLAAPGYGSPAPRTEV